MSYLKRIKPGHSTNCTFCKAADLKVPALWRMSLDNRTACDAHRSTLQDILNKREKLSNQALSEGDYQSWMKL